MPTPLDVLPVEKAKEHLNRQNIGQPGGEDELKDMIGAAVERVERHLGRFPDPASFAQVLACKVVLADYWRTQQPRVASRQGYGGGSMGPEDDTPTSGASTLTKLTALLGPPADDAGSSSQGLFPPPRAFPDPVEPAGRHPW